ncbi:Alpha/Beta hydrolase protein [Dendryphion nanum]|uniref:Alpha/Beta hydrolase protein n=1 Tax=Dendryphion nanum TaxID=256645 RepID=A0A9P9DKU7_9PLEO|nr:Alpha/Beta hydrolase protein [Dendryphion nanum]
MAHKPEAPSVLSLVQLFSAIAFTGLFRATTYVFRSHRASTFRKDVTLAMIRTFTSRVTIVQSRYLLPSTTQAYHDWCKKRLTKPATIDVPTPGANVQGKVQAHWMGSPDANTVVLYLHGGGYSQSISEGYFHYWDRFLKEHNGAGNGKSLSVLILSYSLTPEGRWPMQLREVAATLSYLIDVVGKSPSDIFIAGDSAGGNLVVATLSHLLHPHPDVPTVKLAVPLRGALLISPWVSFRTDWDSYTRNLDTDMLVPGIRRWAAMLMNKTNTDPETDPGPVTGDSYNDALTNDTEWWQGMHHVVSDVFDWSGGDECLVDAIREFDLRFEQGWTEGGGAKSRFIHIESPHQIHIAPIAGMMMDPAGFKSDAQLVIEEWLKSTLEQ